MRKWMVLIDKKLSFSFMIDVRDARQGERTYVFKTPLFTSYLP